LRKLIALYPDHAHGLNALGYLLADANRDLDEAERLLTRALELAPNDPFILDSVGWLRYRQGRLEEALSLLQNAYRRQYDPEIAAHLIEVLTVLGRHEEAQALLKQATARSPDAEPLRRVQRWLEQRNR
jgi:Flp pilus assembly protein TadD